MSTALKPIGDCGPEFGRRVERALRADLRRDAHEATRRFADRMFEIGRDYDRFDRAEAIQAECDRLFALPLSLEAEDVMSLDFSPLDTTRHPIAAPHPLTGLVPTRQARRAEGVNHPAPSARLFTAASSLANDLIALAALGTGMTALVIWACVFARRV